MNSQERHEARYQRRKAERERRRREKLGRYDSLERASTPSAMLTAHWDARKGVLWKSSPARYDWHALKYATRDGLRMRSGRNVCGGFYVFDIIERGKQRHIHSLHYTERVIRRSICVNALVPILSSGLIYDNGASLKDKGIHFAQRRCETHLHKYFRKHGCEGWVLIVDFSKYFDRIDHEILIRQLREKLSDERLLKLCESFIHAGDYDRDVKGQGLYIGPEDSQIYAVAYPNRIDHIIKDEWRMKYYARYMDDSYIIHHDKAELQRIRDKLLQLYAEYGIVPNPKKTQIVKLSRGFTFLKTRFRLTETGKIIRRPDRSSVTRQRRKLKALARFIRNGEITADKAEQSYMSWRGHIRKKEAGRIIYSMDQLYYSLFHSRPWKKGDRCNGKSQRDPGRDQRPGTDAKTDRRKCERFHRGIVQRVQGEHGAQPGEQPRLFHGQCQEGLRHDHLGADPGRGQDRRAESAAG